MGFSIEVGGAHVSLETAPDGEITVAIDVASGGHFGSVKFPVRNEDLDVLRDAVALLAREREFRVRAKALRGIVEEISEAAEATGDGFLYGFLRGLAMNVREQEDE